MFGGGGFFGSGSKQNSTTNNTTNVTQEAGFSEISGQAFSIMGEGNTLTTSDFGAINAARAIAEGAFEQVEISGNNARAAMGSAIAAVEASARGETENIAIQLGKWLALGVMGFGAAWAIKGIFGK